MSRRGRGLLRLTPAWLPTVRAHLVRECRAQAMAGHIIPAGEPMLVGYWSEVDALAVCPLWWVSRDMRALCVDTMINGPMPPLRRLPATTGLMVFEGGFTTLLDGDEVHADAIAWQEDLDGPRDGLGMPGVYLRLYGTGEDARRHLIDRRPPLAPYRMSKEPDPDAVRLLRVAAALMDQPSVTRVESHRWDERRDGPRPRGLSMASGVRMIVLREPARAMTDGGGGGSRAPLSHRFIVRGFYRDQPYGPGGALRRRQWIPPYVKGPADKPLVVKESVRIWRRP